MASRGLARGLHTFRIMDANRPPGYPVRTWSGDERGWPDAALAQGPVRISGTVLDSGASWHAARDRFGWTTVVLIGRAGATPGASALASAVVRAEADQRGDPMRTAQAMLDHLGPEAERAELGVVRIAPHGLLVELLNVSLPAIIHHDPIDGTCPFEPVARGARRLPLSTSTDMVRLRTGAILVAATSGVLSHDAGWTALNGLVSALGLDHFGGLVADTPPPELGRLVRSSWAGAPGPRGLVAIGLPSAAVRVA